MGYRVLYSVYCTDEAAWVDTELDAGAPVPVACPHDGGHVLNSTLTRVIGRSYSADYASVEGEDTSASLNWENRVTLPVYAEVAEEYLVQWYMEVQSTSRSARVKARVQLDGSADLCGPEMNPDIQDISGWAAFSGSIRTTLTEGNHALTIDYSSSKNGKGVKIRRARLRAQKVED